MAAKLADGDLMLEFTGVAKGLAFRKAVSKSGGNDYWAVLARTGNGDRYFSKYGVKVPALSKSLPKVVIVKDPSSDQTVQLALTAGTTDSGNPKVHATKKVTLPNGEERMLTVSISSLDGDRWNVIAKAIGIGGGGGSQTIDPDDL